MGIDSRVKRGASRPITLRLKPLLVLLPALVVQLISATGGCGGQGPSGWSVAQSDRGGAGDSGPAVLSDANGNGGLFGYDGAMNDAGGSGVSSAPTPVTIDGCSSKYPTATLAAIRAGGPVGSMSWLYPLDKTVFPHGLYPPLLQYAPPSSSVGDLVLVHMKSQYFEYLGCAVPTNPPRFQVPTDVWKTAEIKSQGSGDPIAVEITTKAGRAVSGPIKETWTLAPGGLKGSVYYNTYDSPLANNTGAILRVRNGDLRNGIAQPTVFVAADPNDGCVSCHSISANGKVLLAAHHYVGQGGKTDFSASWDLSGNPKVSPPIVYQSPYNGSGSWEAAFGALYPDGSRFMSVGTPSTGSGVSAPGPGNMPGMDGPNAATLFDSHTGTAIAAKGWDVAHANMPMFSADGTKIAFNDFDASQGHTLLVMDFDATSNTFSNKQILFQDSNRYPGWPVFTPDGKSVIFTLATPAAGLFTDYYTTFGSGARSDLYIVDIATKQATPLKTVDGFAKGGGFTLPAGEARDGHLSFYTTMYAHASGGYGWLFFTSERTYGNVITDPLPTGLAVTGTPVKKIWLAAIDLYAPPGTDPSHPAIYLPGQEAASGNHRAFAALDPCTQDGTSCDVGTDCCSGFCTDGTCGKPKPRCSKLDEKCTVSSDCCDASQRCLSGYCGVVTLQ